MSLELHGSSQPPGKIYYILKAMAKWPAFACRQACNFRLAFILLTGQYANLSIILQGARTGIALGKLGQVTSLQIAWKVTKRENLVTKQMYKMHVRENHDAGN